MPTAANVLATANPTPRLPAITKNCVGSINGEAIQKAMTGASGTPAAKRPAMSGITPHEQKGVRPPTTAAMGITQPSRPSKARATIASVPLALAAAANRTESANHGASPASSAAT